MDPEIHIPEEGPELPADNAGDKGDEIVTEKNSATPNVMELITKFLERHFSIANIFGEPGQLPNSHLKRKTALKASFKIFIGVLWSLPVLCALGFIGSLLGWNPGAGYEPIHFLGQTIAFDGILKTISISGLIGFSTNLVAIRMLFKPVVKRPIWGQGLIPAQRDRIIDQIAKGIHENILSEALIHRRIEESGILKRINNFMINGSRNLLKDEEFHAEIRFFIHQHLTNWLRQESIVENITGHIDDKLEQNLNSGIKKFIFKTYKRLNKDDYEAVLENMIQSVPDSVVEGIEHLQDQSEYLTDYLEKKDEDIENFITKMVISLLDKVDIRELLIQQMAHFDETKLERMVWQATNEQLVYIQLLGTVLGILGGLLIWQPLVMLSFFSILLAALIVLDKVIFAFYKKKSIPVEKEH